ncbi:AAA domain-containing protein [Catellatospora methionotrophica]|uniref:AAA domain-containing protein n=1 Tax=Catellatospora methionotrophica TaxID=121620 RepID=UPI003400C606
MTVSDSVPQLPQPSHVALATRRWADALVDDSGRNQLAYYRDLRAGTLRLDAARPEAVTVLTAGRTVTLRQLFPDDVAHADAMRRTRTIRTRMRTLAEERGVDVGYLASGIASWWEADRTPRSPVLLHRLTVRTTSAAETDFALTLDTEPTVNPVLLFKLFKEHRLDIDPEALLDALPDGPYDPAPLFEQLAKAAQDVRGFTVGPELLVGTFLYEKLPMVADITEHSELLESSEVIAALAGDPRALSELYATAPVEPDAPDRLPPGDEFLVLDADSSQSYAVNAAVAGHHLVVKGPPGTGKSQTIANMIMALAARGRTALFVAEKRAAIDAVLDRLNQVGLDDLVQNLHGDQSSRRELARALDSRLQRARHETRPTTEDTDRSLLDARGALAAHHAALHTKHDPWGLSMFELQSRLLGVSPTDMTPQRWSGDDLARLDAPTAARLRAAVTELAQLGAFDAEPGPGPWVRSTIPDRAAAQLAYALAGQAATTLAPARQRLTALAAQLGLSVPGTLSSAQKMAALLAEVDATLRRLRPEAYTADLAAWVTASQTGPDRASMSFWQRRKLLKQIRAHWIAPGRPSTAELHQAAVAAADELARWRVVSRDGQPPRTGPSAAASLAVFAEFAGALESLRGYVPVDNDDLTLLQPELDRLAGDQADLLRTARRNELAASLVEWRARRLLDELAARGVGGDTARAGAAFDHAWLSSVLEHVRFTDEHLSTFHGAALHAAVTSFHTADAAHITAAAQRVRHLAARNLMAVLDEFPDQQQLVRREAAKKARHLPVRRLFEQAPDALTALKPCWAMSPLLVSQVLPARVLFDVVIFDEASQVEPVDGVPAIMRGRQVVVAGDEHQLPPTNFFQRADGDADTPDDGTALGDDVESLLQAFAHTLPLPQVRHLAWHYRSRDERLIAFSDRHVYAPNGNALTTFPGADAGDCISHVLVTGEADPDASAESGSAEVRRVVELILAHAAQRPAESLGVITMGITHAERVDAALRRALATRPELEPYFSEHGHEPFFVKNIERVQGDERDAVILTVGYPKGLDGRMLYRFGPLNTKGGHRRLNVAITRARRRMTVVSSFTHLDMDPQRLRAEGAVMLRDFLAYASSGGRRESLAAVTAPALNPFEADVLAKLTAAGIPLVVQHGVGGHRIDFAATHPDDPERLVLAIEADGASYHASPTVRDRDRLRQQHLERLGWRFHRIWSTDWMRQREVEIAKARAVYDLAVSASAGLPMDTVADGVTLRLPSATPRSLPKPELPPTAQITEVPRQTLVDLVRWIESDGLNRTEDEVVAEATTELGFARRGPRITETLRQVRRETIEGGATS